LYVVKTFFSGSGFLCSKDFLCIKDSSQKYSVHCLYVVKTFFNDFLDSKDVRYNKDTELFVVFFCFCWCLQGINGVVIALCTMWAIEATSGSTYSMVFFPSPPHARTGNAGVDWHAPTSLRRRRRRRRTTRIRAGGGAADPILRCLCEKNVVGQHAVL
jgi:hypothetical protein